MELTVDSVYIAILEIVFGFGLVKGGWGDVAFFVKLFLLQTASMGTRRGRKVKERLSSGVGTGRHPRTVAGLQTVSTSIWSSQVNVSMSKIC